MVLALKMRFKKSINCFFVGYLGLLINLGPSLHRADFFGLHSHGAGSVSSHCSCCCHGHAQWWWSSDCDPVEPVEAPLKRRSQTVSSNHDCAFCEFFDQFHVMVAQCDQQEPWSAGQLLPSCRPVAVFAATLSPAARGPPCFA